MCRLAIVLLLAVPLAAPAAASSDDAWETFRAEVRTACAALADPGAETVVTVNPFGSESYGVALVKATYAEGSDLMVCIYDKAAKTAELSAPFLPDE